MGFLLGCFRCGSGCRAKTDDRVCPERVLIGSGESPEAGLKRYSWGEIESMSMKFKEVIGVGGYSTVYLAKFPDSTVGAVKIYNGSERLNQVFKSELEISQKLHHANIVNLLGYCDDRDEGVLIFEYIPNGNLQERLHSQNPTPPDNKCSISSNNSNLTWKQRISIAYQLAQALEYLHESHDLHIVHGDIKASNILLDTHLNCRLCDFGFAKVGFTSMVKPPSSSRLAMMGSPGYIDPHFLMTGLQSKKSDVYSFGVILLELITGFEAFVCRGDQQVLLTSMVRTKDNFDVEKVVKMVDPRLVRGEQVDEEEVKEMGLIAGACLHHLPSLRPSASEICRMMRERISCVSLLVPSEKL